MLRSSIAFLLVLSIILSGCAPSLAPAAYLPKDESTFVTDSYGGFLVVSRTNYFTPGDWVTGEFIAQDSVNVYLLTDSVYVIPKQSIKAAHLELVTKGKYGFWLFCGILSTATHGMLLILTLPMWAIIGGGAIASESSRDLYRTFKPDAEYWDSIKLFARFPAGIPENIPMKDIKPKPYRSQ